MLAHDAWARPVSSAGLRIAAARRKLDDAVDGRHGQEEVQLAEAPAHELRYALQVHLCRGAGGAMLERLQPCALKGLHRMDALARDNEGSQRHIGARHLWPAGEVPHDVGDGRHDRRAHHARQPAAPHLWSSDPPHMNRPAALSRLHSDDTPGCIVTPAHSKDALRPELAEVQ